jgi:KDO2-lipid IV(A) lauroyltransferase
MQTLFKFLSFWPLWSLRALGVSLGWMVWALSARYRRQLDLSLKTALLSESARRAGLSQSAFGRLRRASIAQAGLLVSELPRIWCNPKSTERVQTIGLDLAQSAVAAGRGLVFLTPHLGAFELAPRLLARDVCPMTVLYRPARKPSMERLLRAFRPASGVRAVPANASGVRQLLKTLRAGEAIGMLPDQVPTAGDGVWSTTWGQPAYTMSLPLRLAQATGAAIFWVVVVRVSSGWEMRVTPWVPESQSLEEQVNEMNQRCEQEIWRAPSQYLWAYNRHKTPVYRGQSGHRT